MPPPQHYIDQIQALDQQGLLGLFTQIGADNTPGWPNGKALEYLVLRAFQLEGAEVQWPYSVHLQGAEIEQIDGVVYADGFACIAECKDTAEAVNVEPIAKLRNQLLRRPSASIGSVFSWEGFTEPARILASYLSPQTILLWERHELEFALRNQSMIPGLRRKYRYCVEHGLPDFNITT